MIRINNLTLTLEKSGRKIVDGLNFTLAGGDKVAVIGEEGDGKSTLIKYIYDPSLTSGYVSAAGSVVKRGTVGYLSQFASDIEGAMPCANLSARTCTER